MNDDNSDRTEDGSHYVFIRDKNSNPSEYYRTSPSTRRPPVSHGDWSSSDPDDMVVDYEMDPAVDSSESVSLSHPCVAYPEPPGGFMRKCELAVYSELSCQSPALGKAVKPPNPHSDFDSREAIQDEKSDPSKPCVRESDDDYACGDTPETLELRQTDNMKVDTVTCTFIAHQALRQGWPLRAPGGLQPTVRDGNALSCSDQTPPPSSEMCGRGITYNREDFENLQATPSKALNTTYPLISDMLMQTDSPDIGMQCQNPLGNATKEYTDGRVQGLVGEKEIQAVTLVSDGMEVPNGSLLQEFSCVSEDDPNSETHSHGSDAQQGQNLQGTLSDCHVDGECSVLVPAFDMNRTRVLDSECKVTVTEDPHIDSLVNDSDIQSSPEGLNLRSVPGQRVSSCEMGWDENGRAIGTDDTAFTSSPVKQLPDVSFTLSPVEVTKKYNNVANGPRDAKSAPNLKGEPTNMPKPNLGKSATKTNTTVGSKVRKTEIISYPRPNFKNIKAKVISRSVLQPKDTSPMKDTPNPQVSRGSSPSPVPSKQLTITNKTPRSDFKADKKAEIPINKTHKQQFNKLLTSQAAQVTTHSKNASLRVPRTTSATKSNQEDVDKTGSPHAGSETGSVAAFFQKIKGILPVKMKSSECLELPYVSHIDQISPEKGEQDCEEAPMEKQALGKPAMNETFESKSLFVDSAPRSSTTAGRSSSKPDSRSLRKAPGLKAKVGPAASCLRRRNDSRTLSSDRALSPQRIRRVSGSGGNAAINKYEEKPPKQPFQNGSGPLYLKPLVPRAHAHLLKTSPKGPSRKSLFTAFNSGK